MDPCLRWERMAPTNTLTGLFFHFLMAEGWHRGYSPGGPLSAQHERFRAGALAEKLCFIRLLVLERSHVQHLKNSFFSGRLCALASGSPQASDHCHQQSPGCSFFHDKRGGKKRYSAKIVDSAAVLQICKNPNSHRSVVAPQNGSEES